MRKEAMVEFSVTVVVRLILWFGADAHKYKNEKVGHEVGQRVDGIGYHSRAVAQHAGDELKGEQCGIACAAHQRRLVYFPFPAHLLSVADGARYAQLTDE